MIVMEGRGDEEMMCTGCIEGSQDSTGASYSEDLGGVLAIQCLLWVAGGEPTTREREEEVAAAIVL